MVTPYPALALFLECLIQRYPTISAYPYEDVVDCTCNCDWSVTPGSVIFCIAWSRAEEIASLLVDMSNAYDLVCNNQQRDRIGESACNTPLRQKLSHHRPYCLPQPARCAMLIHEGMRPFANPCPSALSVIIPPHTTPP